MATEKSITPQRLAELRAMPYLDYLFTDEWKETASERRAIAKWKCEECGRRRPLDVHHLTYKRLGQERMEDLKSLCRPCHKAVEKEKELYAQWAQMTLAEARELKPFDGYLLWLLRAVAGGSHKTPVLSALEIRELSNENISVKQIGRSALVLARAGKISAARSHGGMAYTLLDTETSPKWRWRSPKSKTA